MTESLAVLVAATVSTAVVHTLIPDHWLPFVLVARSRKWETRVTLLLTAGSALLHVSVSVGLGLAARFVGHGAETAVGLGESIERWAGGILVVFGLAYAGWFLRRGGHQHHFGMHPHHEPGVAHPPSNRHPHDLAPSAAGAPGGNAPPRNGIRSGLALAAIVGFNPCVLVIPYIYLAGAMGTLPLALVSAAFAISTIACMVVLAMLGLKGTARLESTFLVRYGEAVSGGLIAVTGLAILIVGA